MKKWPQDSQVYSRAYNGNHIENRFNVLILEKHYQVRTLTDYPEDKHRTQFTEQENFGTESL